MRARHVQEAVCCCTGRRASHELAARLSDLSRIVDAAIQGMTAREGSSPRPLAASASSCEVDNYREQSRYFLAPGYDGNGAGREQSSARAGSVRRQCNLPDRPGKQSWFHHSIQKRSSPNFYSPRYQ